MKSRSNNSYDVKWFSLLFEPQINGEQVLAIIRKYHKPFSPDFSLQQLTTSQAFVIKRYQGAIYLGDQIEMKRQGKGILFYENGRMFEGSWKNDLKDGFGNEVFANRNHYEGYYVKGKPEGKGLYVWANGELYDGQWFEGKKHGSGVWQGPKGDSYMGEWKDGSADGYGVHVWTNGDRYEGQFKNNLKNGQGKEVFANGDIYVGFYVNGKPSGYGEYFWRNGTVYRGYFKDGMRHGQGVWTKIINKATNEFERYSGFYVNDQKSGYGIYEWPNGNIYQGQFLEDLRHGYGMMKWSDGSFYKGQWEKGNQHGRGILHIGDEEPLLGIFFEGQQKDLISDEDQKNELTQVIEDVLHKVLEETKAISQKSTQQNQREKPVVQGYHSTDEYERLPSVGVGRKHLTQMKATEHSYDELKIKLHKLTRSRQISTDIKKKKKGKPPRSKDKITEMMNVYSFSDEPSGFFHTRKSEDISPYLGYNGFKLNTTGANLKKMSNTYLSDRSAESIAQHIERRQQPNKMPSLDRRVWVPSGSFRRSPG